MRTLILNFKSNVYWLVALLFLISCNSKGNQTVASHLDTVIIKQMQFNPAELKVNKGDTIVFINRDYVQHDVSNKNKEFYSDTLNVGSSWKMVAEKNADYFCSIHPTMTGKIILNQ